jgi:hypothetical protein
LFAVALLEPIALEPVVLERFVIAPLLLAPPVVPAVAAGRFPDPELLVPGAAVCADTAAAMQNDTTPATRAGPEKRLVDMFVLHDLSEKGRVAADAPLRRC